MADNTLLSGRTAVVVGGARGLGLAMARALAQHGADIALLDVIPDVGASAARLADETGVGTTSSHVDVTDENSIRSGFDIVSRDLDVPTILVNSAGITLGVPALDNTLEQWQRIMNVNLTGSFLTSKEFARRVVDAGKSASIVNVSSMSGYIVNVPQTQTAYNVSKAGVAMLTQSLAVEWLPLGIRVNAIAPGYFASDMTRDFVKVQPEMAREWMSRVPAGRMGEPEELGDLVVYLASERSRFIVGQNILIDGGYTLI